MDMEIKGFVGLILFSPIIAFVFLTYGFAWLLYPYAVIIYWLLNCELLTPENYGDMVGKPFNY